MKAGKRCHTGPTDVEVLPPLLNDWPIRTSNTRDKQPEVMHVLDRTGSVNPPFLKC